MGGLMGGSKVAKPAPPPPVVKTPDPFAPSNVDAMRQAKIEEDRRRGIIGVGGQTDLIDLGINDSLGDNSNHAAANPNGVGTNAATVADGNHNAVPYNPTGFGFGIGLRPGSRGATNMGLSGQHPGNTGYVVPGSGAYGMPGGYNPRATKKTSGNSGNGGISGF